MHDPTAMTYSGNPANSDLDRLRFTVGDTEEDNMFLTNGEVMYILDTNQNFDRAVIEALERIVYILAKDVYSALGPSQYQAQQKFAHYKGLLEERKHELAIHSGARPFVGGIHTTDKQARSRDGSLIQPSFTRQGRHYRAPRP